MQATVMTATLAGVEAMPVEVQADVSSGLPMFGIVGLGDAAVMEARERVRAAVRAAGLDFPNARVMINLAPAPLRKHGTGFDLPIALAILRATGQIPVAVTEGAFVVGELGLDGSVRPVRGMLAHALAATRHGMDLLGPQEALDAAVAAQTPGCRVVSHIGSLRTGTPDTVLPVRSPDPMNACAPDIGDVAGQAAAKRALEIAAVGGHNLLMSGPPGSGKTMLAHRLCGILPPLADSDRLSTALIHSVAGVDEAPALAGIRPFRAPHHSASVVGLIGGGTPPRPGEVSLAHNGVLFLDEFAEFAPSTLQALRQPMESGEVALVRAEGRVRYPARFTLVAAMNPCPCGYYGDPTRSCRCTQPVIDKYVARIGGPLMDRIDIRIRVDRIDPRTILDEPPEGLDSRTISERVAEAVAFRRSRPEDGALQGNTLVRACRLDPRARRALEALARTLSLSGRAVTRTLRVARTIADLSCTDTVGEAHILEAIGYRGEDS